MKEVVKEERKSIDKPKISVIIPAYNAQKYIRESINSILNQTLKPFEIIVVNDGSTDETRNIIGKWSQKESLIHLITQDNEGIGSARKREVSFLRSLKA